MYYKEIETSKEASRARDILLKKMAADRLRAYAEYKKRRRGG